MLVIRIKWNLKGIKILNHPSQKILSKLSFYPNYLHSWGLDWQFCRWLNLFGVTHIWPGLEIGSKVGLWYCDDILVQNILIITVFRSNSVGSYLVYHETLSFSLWRSLVLQPLLPCNYQGFGETGVTIVMFKWV